MDVFGWNIPLWFILLLLLLFAFYRYSTSTFGTFKEMNVPGPKPWPLVGNIIPLFTKGMWVFDKMLIAKHGKICGSYFGRRPNLLIGDPETLKRILVKDFTSFRNRYVQVLNSFPLDRMLPSLEDDHWKHVRNHLTPTFSGSKLRRMMGLLNKCCESFVSNLEEPAKTGDMFEGMDYCGSYTMDVIASTAFSIDIDTKRDKNSRFVRMAKKMMDFGSFNLAFIIFYLCPPLVPYMSKFGVSVFPKDCLEFFTDILNNNIKEREKNPDETPKDFLQLMLNSQVEDLDEEDVRNGDAPNQQLMSGSMGIWSKSGLTHEEILSQCMIFFFAGYSTTANSLSLLMYHLATYPECQEKVYQEILDVVGPTKDPTYDDMKKFPYLDMCVEENLRLYPPAPFVDRVATEDFEIAGLRIPKGMTITVPIYALQTDPDVWPEPEKFIPERFSPEEKENRHPFQYMPFGLGPRNCIGMRLALLEMKMAVVHTVRNFKLLPSEKTQIPLTMKKVQAEPENGNWLRAEIRT